jgi:competence protein ComEC
MDVGDPGGITAERAGALPGLGARQGLLALFARALVDNFNGEQDRWILWVPVALGIGIAVYFLLRTEPPWWIGGAAVALLAGLAATSLMLPAGMRRPIAGLLLAAAVIACGFALAQGRAALVAAPIIGERLGPTPVKGQVVEVETLPDGYRITLENPSIVRLNKEDSPARLRLRLKGDQPPLQAGDVIDVLAVVMPPPPPSAPGAFDFQRMAYFQRLGGVGYAVGPVEVMRQGRNSEVTELAIWISRLRQAVGDRVLAHLEGAVGGISVALINGEWGPIPNDVMAAMRDSGLAHLLSISGLHISLVAGFIMLSLRGLLALIPPLALRYPIKKWAAALAFAGAAGYVVLAGAPVPAQRSLVMVGIVLLGVLVDRQALSMRLVAWAAVVILVLQPEALLGASLQMSFAAVTALVAACEFQKARRSAPLRRRGWLISIALYLGGIGLTSLVASTATAPFAAYHFNRFALYGLAANMVAVPVTGIWIMPMAVIALVVMPLGLEAIPLTIMGWGVGVVIKVAEAVAAWPGAASPFSAFPAWGLTLVAMGGLWLCIWQRRWRLIGVPVIAAGVASALLVETPHILIDAEGKLMAVQAADGTLLFSSARADPIARDTWQRRSGHDAHMALWPRTGPSADGLLGCDPLGCIYRRQGYTVAFVNRREALLEDCRRADLMISADFLGKPCQGLVTVIDRSDLRRWGAHAVWLEPDRIRTQRVNEERGRRPWVLEQRPRRKAYTDQ